MDYFLNSFLEANLPYVSLLVGVVASLMLYVVILYQVQQLRCSLVLYKQRVEGLENQLSAVGGKKISESAETPDSTTASEDSAPPRSQATQHKVLQLHNLGRSNGEIAREAGIREAEVDFVLKVSQHLSTPGGDLALRKIS